MQKSLSFTRALSFALNGVFTNFVTIVGLIVFWAAIILAGVFIFIGWTFLNAALPVAGVILLPAILLLCIIGLLFLFLLPSFFQMQLIGLSIATHRQKKIAFKDLFTFKLGEAVRFAVLQWLRSFIIGLGILFFIIPGLYFMVVYAFPGFTLVDGTTNSIEDDFNTNTRLTKGARLGIFFAFLVPYLFMAFSAGTLFVMLKVTHLHSLYGYVIAIISWLSLPLTTFFYVSLYEQLKEQTEEAQPTNQQAMSTA